MIYSPGHIFHIADDLLLCLSYTVDLLEECAVFVRSDRNHRPNRMGKPHSANWRVVST